MQNLRLQYMTLCTEAKYTIYEMFIHTKLEASYVREILMYLAKTVLLEYTTINFQQSA